MEVGNVSVQVVPRELEKLQNRIRSCIDEKTKLLRGKAWAHVYLVQPFAQPEPTMLLTVTATQLPLEVLSEFKCDGLAKLTEAGSGILKAAAALAEAMSPLPASHEFQRAIAISVDF